METKNNRCFLKIIIVAVILLILILPLGIKFFYPQPYRSVVLAYSKNYEVDPLLVYALIRRESRYREQVESSAGALGLMQILPDTANWLAEKDGSCVSCEEELKTPDVNIQLGCFYLFWLSEEFQGRLPVMLAAYNAGHGKVEEWLNDGIWDGTEKNLQQIPFNETQKYVRDVLKNYWVYQILEKMHLYSQCV